MTVPFDYPPTQHIRRQSPGNVLTLPPQLGSRETAASHRLRGWIRAGNRYLSRSYDSHKFFHKTKPRW
jgi:hypothetical protein